VSGRCRVGPCAACSVALALWVAGAEAVRAQEMIVNPGVGTTQITTNEARLYMTSRLKAWPNGVPVKVFVLPDDNPLHRRFVNSLLGLFPYQLRRVWDRQLFSGTGQVPATVASESEMIRRVSATPGALGYVESVPDDGSVRPLEVR
jgi:hypothetical protein